MRFHATAPQTSIPSVAKVLKSRRGWWHEIDIGPGSISVGEFFHNVARSVAICVVCEKRRTEPKNGARLLQWYYYIAHSYVTILNETCGSPKVERNGIFTLKRMLVTIR